MKTFIISVTTAAVAMGLAVAGITSVEAGKLTAKPEKPQTMIYNPYGKTISFCGGRTVCVPN